MYKINQFIEHTLLRPDIVDSDVSKLVEEAIDYSFLGVCVPPFWVKRASREISKSRLQLITVVGFPFGYSMTEAKVEEIDRAIESGANELDVVINISAFKSNMSWAKIELAKFSKIIHNNGCLMKTIIETAYLTNDEIVEACKIAVESGTDFVKTSTGFAPTGAKAKTVKLIRKNIPQNVGVKASGGIKDYGTARLMIESGADRLGMSSSLKVIKESFELNS